MPSARVGMSKSKCKPQPEINGDGGKYQTGHRVVGPHGLHLVFHCLCEKNMEGDKGIKMSFFVECKAVQMSNLGGKKT